MHDRDGKADTECCDSEMYVVSGLGGLYQEEAGNTRCQKARPLRQMHAEFGCEHRSVAKVSCAQRRECAEQENRGTAEGERELDEDGMGFSCGYVPLPESEDMCEKRRRQTKCQGRRYGASAPFLHRTTIPRALTRGLVPSVGTVRRRSSRLCFSCHLSA